MHGCVTRFGRHHHPDHPTTPRYRRLDEGHLKQRSSLAYPDCPEASDVQVGAAVYIRRDLRRLYASTVLLLYLCGGYQYVRMHQHVRRRYALARTCRPEHALFNNRGRRAALSQCSQNAEPPDFRNEWPIYDT